MYGSYGMYSGNRTNFSPASNLYKPAGVVNIRNSYGTKINGEMTSLPSQSFTSVVMGTVTNETSFEQLTNAFPGVQHIDYQQNPSPIILPVRQTGRTANGTVGIYADDNIDGQPVVGTYVEQYTPNSISNVLIQQPQTVPITINYQNLIKTNR
jgi:hypothetical protein